MSYDPEPYEQSVFVKMFHNAPRFGAPDNITSVLTAEDEKVALIEYATGISFLGGIILAIFLFWSLLLLIFKCLNKTRVGYLSGARFSNDMKKCCCCGTTLVRSSFVFSTIMLFALCGLTSKYASQEANDTLDSMQQSVQKLDALVEDGNETVAQLLSLGRSLVTVRASVETTYINVKTCLDDVMEKIEKLEELKDGVDLDNITNIFEGNVSIPDSIGGGDGNITIPGEIGGGDSNITIPGGIGGEDNNVTISDVGGAVTDTVGNIGGGGGFGGFGGGGGRRDLQSISDLDISEEEIQKAIDEINSLIQDLDDFGDFYVTTLEDLSVTLDNVDQNLDRADELLEDGKDYTVYFNYIMIPTAVLGAILLLGTALASCNKTGCAFESFESYLVMPLLFLESNIFWLLAIVMGVVAIANADVCSPNPTETVLLVVDEQYSSNPAMIEIVEYYVGGCESVNPLEAFLVYEQQISDTLNQVNETLQYLDGHGILDATKEYCSATATNPQDYDPEVIQSFVKLIDDAYVSIESVMTLLQCERIYDVYSSVLDESTCTALPDLVGASFFTLLFLAVSGYSIATYRSAYLSDDFDSEDGNDDELEEGESFEVVQAVEQGIVKKDDSSSSSSSSSSNSSGGKKAPAQASENVRVY